MLTSRFTFRRGSELYEVLVKSRWETDDLRQVKLVNTKATPLFLEDDDFSAGGDVFALDFFLMRQSAEIIEGKDLLENLEISQQDLKTCLEGEVRRLSSKARLTYFRNRIIPAKAAMVTLQGIAEALEYLGCQEAFSESEKAIFSSFSGNFLPRRQTQAFLKLLQKWETFLEEK